MLDKNAASVSFLTHFPPAISAVFFLENERSSFLGNIHAVMVVEYFRMLQVSHPLGLALLPETAVVERSQVWIQGPGAVDDDTCFRILGELIQDVQPAS
jgi:hypothetical protein